MMKFLKAILTACRAHPVAAAIIGIVATAIVSSAYFLGRSHGAQNAATQTAEANTIAATATQAAQKISETNQELGKKLENSKTKEAATHQALQAQTETAKRLQEENDAIRERAEKNKKAELLKQQAANININANVSTPSPSSAATTNANTSYVQNPLTNMRQRGRTSGVETSSSQHSQSRSPSPT